ncbi:2-succinyl-5-enolpyruvyl-6-hydroxy-3-cyclohexene-1-carboxylic-acid synthase [Arenibacter sp. 6A1]|uniref:2-succinyl-5-enolpyruvyl-6-hydroxy-3- cyclohexene-1-carboxylic-acid synthase n=1 Tax=Arenibacter sp. 6A1 TaxID=2720391 RepID=UPI0014462122|nr:2-succinyl-5-enolpyruvyl-6-hydroxy-3-cyclohexene-1-carboxylic-acid synthase [Arenibacter sp. 6A1]NKI25889.1 2-succinyl-5-enolpyruvyl-6-hydroxy-3-cyclohexene-1-carboxylic-acid synthase [Arenibacter sp. 6A1]
MKYSSIPTAQSVVYHCKARGIKNVIISPGSRNAPLTIGFSEDPYFECFSIVDERCAAFFALGIAQQTRKPVVILCSSGSALLNYYPAISEAFYSDIPLVVLTADRPSYKVDIGDGQTIRQENVFENHIGYTANLKQDVGHATDKIKKYAPEQLLGLSPSDAQASVQQYNDGELNEALKEVLSQNCPVHINVPFEEPLYDVLEDATVVPKVDMETFENDPWTEDLKEVAKIWSTSARKLVLVGVNYPNTIMESYLKVLGEDPSVIVFTESTSNLHHDNFFPSIDSIIAPIEKSDHKEELFQDLQPDIVLTLGGLIVSKKVKAFLRTYSPSHHWHVDAKKAYNTFFCLTKHFKTDPNNFFKELFSLSSPVKSVYHQKWAKKRQEYQLKRQAFISEIPFSDMLVFNDIIKTIPQGYQLQLANSSTVRYAQLFDLDASIRVFCNRGTSGIDGSTSTAIGAALLDNNPTLLITGDLSFLYDSNGLWNRYTRPDFRIIVINNNGGGIFRILPGKAETENFERFFETTHQLNIEPLATMYGFEYGQVSDEGALRAALEIFYQPSDRPKILEVSTPRLINDKILLNYFDFIS